MSYTYGHEQAKKKPTDLFQKILKQGHSPNKAKSEFYNKKSIFKVEAVLNKSPNKAKKKVKYGQKITVTNPNMKGMGEREKLMRANQEQSKSNISAARATLYKDKASTQFQLGNTSLAYHLSFKSKSAEKKSHQQSYRAHKYSS